MADNPIDPKSNYYDVGGIPTMDIIKAKLTPEQFEGFILGNLLKYSCRVNFKHKNGIRDGEKMKIYSGIFKELQGEN